MKNVLTYVAIFILASSLAAAATVTLEPIETYESVEAEFNLEVNNYLGNDVIEQLSLNSPDMEIIDVLDFLGWTSDFTSSQITWSDGRIETNVRNALFIYTAKADLVSQDETKTLTGTLTYEDTTTDAFSLNITVRNDDTSPILNSMYPEDGSYGRAHATQNVIVNASDPETGIKSATYEFSDCTNSPTQVQLTCNNGYCTGQADFANYGEDDTACFNVIITNNADESTSISGTFGFDETPPTVNLLSPINNDYESNMFRFDVSDNKASEFLCRLEIDSNEVQTLDAFTGVNAFVLTANVSEGMHDWKIICQDAVGLEGEDEDSFIYDITAPVITLNSPANGTGIKDELIDIVVSDNYEIDSVDYSKDLNSTNWNNGWNTLTVTATDKAGNENIKNFDFYVDKQAPTIDITSPDDQASFDYHGNFVITATDDFDQSIECAISTSVTNPVTQEVDSGVESTINVMLPLGDFTWYMLCVDDLGNSAQSAPRSATSLDLTGPDVVITDLDYVARGTDVIIQATVTDISGIKQVYADFEGNTFDLVDQGNDLYQAALSIDSNEDLGDKTIYVYGIDNNDMTNNAFDEFTVVEKYEITVNVPASVEPGASVTVTGEVTKDDSTTVAGTVTINYPGGATDVTLDANGEFSYSFNAPGSDAAYDVVVTYETSNLVYSRTASFSVVSPSSSGSGSQGIDFDYSGGYSGIKPKDDSSSDTESVPEPEQDSSDSELIEEEPTEEIPEEEPRVPAITGATTGIFSGSSKWWIIALVGLITAAITVHGFYSLKKKKDKGIDWGNKF
jgi:hypothetical protein